MKRPAGRCSTTFSEEGLVRKLAVVAAVLAAVTVSACKKTGPGEYEVQKPVIGTQTDTITTPTLSVGTASTTVSVPEVEVKKGTATVKVPTVQVNPPKKKY
jgi:hypothetical protein